MVPNFSTSHIAADRRELYESKSKQEFLLVSETGTYYVGDGNSPTSWGVESAARRYSLASEAFDDASVIRELLRNESGWAPRITVVIA